jgi:hypothetical protein
MRMMFLIDFGWNQCNECASSVRASTAFARVYEVSSAAFVPHHAASIVAIAMALSTRTKPNACVVDTTFRVHPPSAA